MVTLRKRKNLSQGELGKHVGTSGDIIGKYERDEVKPSIEVASKIADALEVSLDYLVGKTSVEIDANPPAPAGYSTAQRTGQSPYLRAARCFSARQKN